MIDADMIAQALGGFFVLVGGGRMFRSWWKKQNSTDNLSDERDKFIQELKNQAKAWEERHADLLRVHEENVEMIHLLKSQNNMMRLLLLQKGLSNDELIAIGVYPPGAT